MLGSCLASPFSSRQCRSFLPLLAQAVCAGGVICLTGLAWFKRCKAAASVGVFSTVCLVLAASTAPYSQVALGDGLIVYSVVVRRLKWMQEITTWVRWGSFGMDVQVLTAVSALLAAVVLLVRYHFLQPNLDGIVQAFVAPAVPLSILVAGGGITATQVSVVAALDSLRLRDRGVEVSGCSHKSIGRSPRSMTVAGARIRSNQSRRNPRRLARVRWNGIRLRSRALSLRAAMIG